MVEFLITWAVAFALTSLHVGVGPARSALVLAGTALYSGIIWALCLWMFF